MPASTRRLLAVLTLLFTLAPPAALAQEDLVPGRFATTLGDTDLPGGDSEIIYDITFQRCLAACLEDGDCHAFTFDQRNNVCFLKDEVGQPTAFTGAVSGIITIKDEAALALAREAAAEMVFLQDYDFELARDQAVSMAESYSTQGFDEAAWLALVDQGVTLGAAVSATGAAVTVRDSGTAWLAHARALAAQAAPERTYDLFRRATSAAINAALRLNRSERAAALVVMARALEGGYRGEAALAALRLADRIRPGIAAEELARLSESFGFRVLDHAVESETAAPRVCVVFSEPLAQSADYAPFVQRSALGLAIEPEGQRLCLTGVDYGHSYTLTMRAGLPSAAGETLPKDVPIEVYVRDRSPSVRFPGRAYVLPAHGPRALPVETVNADRLELALLHVSDRNLVTSIREGSFLQSLGYWDGERFESNLTESVWTGEARLAGELNRDTTSLLPLDEVGALEPGVYVLRAQVAGADPYDVLPALQWFLVSDLGVTTLAGSDGLHVVVQRLSDGQPVSGLRVELVARSNRALGEATTDAQGHVVFGAALTSGSGNAAPALVLVASADDLAVLSLEDPEFDLSDRGVEGRPSPGPLDVFLASDRGAYRPGETINLTVLVRDTMARAVQGLPLTVRLLRPDGVEYTRVVDTADRAGGYVVALPLGSDVPRGVWRIETLVDTTAPPLAGRTVLVEDFIPERIDVELSLAGDGPVDPAAPPPLELVARHLFGTPAAGMAVTGTVAVATVDTLPEWPGYSFGRYDVRLDTQSLPFTAHLITDAQGRLEAPLPLDRLALDARPYEMTVVATLADGAARPVERTLTRTVRPTAPVVGIRPGFEGALRENSEAVFDLVLVDTDGTATSGELEWQVDRVETRYQWYAVSGRWYWEPVTERLRVGEGAVAVQAGPVRLTVPVTWGRYELRATYRGATVASASLPFAAGWTSAGAGRETPDLLDVALDATGYAPGDVARLRIVPGGPGVALITVLADRVVDLRLVAVAGETTVELPVTDDWGTGVYVTASLIRPSDGPEHLPTRGLGLAHAGIDPGGRVLDVELTAPDETRSGAPLTVVLEVEGLDDGSAYATVAAVDLGILNVTGFEAPDPRGHYFGQRRLGVAIRDLYGRLIDAREGARGEVRSGGDGESAASPGPVPAEDLVALFSGPVELVGGVAELSFDVPAFDGTLRLMAAVWTDTAVGQAVEDVLVRDPVVVQASLPRFLTPGDVGRLRVELTHVTGTAGLMNVSVTGHGLAAAPGTVELREGGRAVLDLDLTPTEVGEHLYRVELITPDGELAARELRLTVQHTDPRTARSERRVLAPGDTFLFDETVLAGFRPGSATATLVVGAGAALDMPGLIMRLNGYPYGCTEQIASSLQPLLLAPGVVARLGLMGAAEAKTRVQEGVDRILTRQASSGGSGLWSAGGFDLWLDAYVTAVLLRAEAYGAVVPPTALRLALDNLRNQVARAGSMFDGAASYAYAFYVLARAGEAVIGDLRYYADTLPESFDTPLAAAHLAAALAAYGERERSEAMFARAQLLALAGSATVEWRDDYGTDLRDRAGLLALAVEADSAVVDRARLVGLIAQGGPADSLSTQEATWVLRAATALGASATGLEVDGQPVTGDVLRLYQGVTTEIRNVGDDDVALTLTSFGVPETAPAAGGVGYTITREHYTPAGEPADLGAVRAGDRLVVVLEVRPQRGVPGGRLIIDAALPAGFEIDNANLLRAGDVRALDWLSLNVGAEATEARADRFLAAVDWRTQEVLRLAYFVRAVTPGEYHYPAPLVEDLYRPVNRAVGATGTLIVRP